MKKILILFLALLFISTVNAQVVFGSSGSEWRYQYRGMSPSGTLAKIYYRSDSIAGPDTLKVFYFSAFFTWTGGEQFHTVAIKQKGDTIFMKNGHTLNSWQILYNFASAAGQSWTTTVADMSNYGDHIARTHTTTVLSTGTVSINNLVLRKLHVTCTGASPGGDTTDIIERIGCTTYLFNYFNLPTISDWGMMTDFLCYKDYVAGTVEFSSLGCNYDVGIAENSRAGRIRLYPTPVSDLLSIDCEGKSSQTYSIRIVNALGQAALTANPQYESALLSVNVSALSKGVYFLELYEQGKLSGVQKIVKD